MAEDKYSINRILKAVGITIASILFGILAATISFDSSKKVKAESEYKQKVIAKMKSENCVELGYIQGGLFVENQYEYFCDGGKQYTLRFRVQGLK